jgi:hypothetical protein
MAWGMMSCDWPCLPNTAPTMVVIVSFALALDALIMSVMAAAALPVTSVVPLKRALVDDRSLSVGQSCSRLWREFAGEAEHASGCRHGTLPTGVARDSSGEC